MPRRGRVKPLLHKQKTNKCIKVKYEQIGKRKIFDIEIPAVGEVNLQSSLEPLIAKRIHCDVADIWIVDEPYMVTKVINDSEV